jgi:hypothetical protein
MWARVMPLAVIGDLGQMEKVIELDVKGSFLERYRSPGCATT